MKLKINNKRKTRDFPGGPVVKTPYFHCRGYGFNNGQGIQILNAAWHSHKNLKKNFKNRKLRKFTNIWKITHSYITNRL